MKYRYIIIGTSRSGKSTVAKMLQQKIGGVYIDVIEYVSDFIKRTGISQNENDFRLLKKPYENLCKDLINGKKWDILEIASDFPEYFLPKIVSANSNPVILIFCDCSLKTCLARNRKERRAVPEAILRKQDEYDKDFYTQISFDLGIKLVSLNTESGAKKVFQELQEKMEPVILLWGDE